MNRTASANLDPASSSLNSIAPDPAQVPGDYILMDGSGLRLRELAREDRERLRSFFACCSFEAIRYRFLSSVKGLSDVLLDSLVDTDCSRHVALIVTLMERGDERIVAEGRYVCFNDRPEVADVALLVVDHMQRRGIGTLLIENLTEIARRNGITGFSADVLADNRGMLSLLRKTRHPMSTEVSHGVMHFELRIAGEECSGIPAAA